ncbi:hypothetical protein HNY73_019613 [Argiope bruennichi]|uniref:Uncharacterized protein n=1 Tax=Argiope bruennichi TaxID=94029 RepID=A0A8T0E4X5_ARGBR|nr:hypothetical protein HNY73_019613 [Argiope bruennichi]
MANTKFATSSVIATLLTVRSLPTEPFARSYGPEICGRGRGPRTLSLPLPRHHGERVRMADGALGFRRRVRPRRVSKTSESRGDSHAPSCPSLDSGGASCILWAAAPPQERSRAIFPSPTPFRG